MKIYIVLLSVIITAAGTGCKKNNTGTNNPSTGKKVVVTTIAGEGTGAFADGPALSAKFNAPTDVIVAADGTLFVTDYKNHRIRKIAAGQVTTFAGNDNFVIVNGKGISAQFNTPFRIASDAGSNLYTVEQVDTHVRKISPAADVTFYAGTSMPGYLNGSAVTAQFQYDAAGIVADEDGTIYIVDTFNGRIRKIDPSGQVSTLAGSGTMGFRDAAAEMAQFNYPDGIAIDKEGNLYVSDAANFRIRKITPAGVVSTLAGSGVKGTLDGNAGSAQFNDMGDMVADSEGNLYIADDNRIRKITPQGVVSTIAGGAVGYADGDGARARFAYPAGLGIDAHNNIYVADANNNRIRKISFE